MKSSTTPQTALFGSCVWEFKKRYICFICIKADNIMVLLQLKVHTYRERTLWIETASINVSVCRGSEQNKKKPIIWSGRFWAQDQG